MTGTTSTRVIAVVGPTAVGKSTLAEGLAAQLPGEIVSADSMQVYRGMDIGTAKPPEPQAVRYHLIDVADPGEEYSAARFQAEARAAISDISARDRTPIIAGGTGLYIRAALDDWDIPAGDSSDSRRGELESIAEDQGPAALHTILVELDPKAAELIHPNNSRRVIRALEMHAHGVSYADQAARFSARESVYDARFVGLTMQRDDLYRRIDARVEGMLDAGLLDEVRGLLAAGLRDAVTAAQAIGYKEFVPVLEEGADLQAAVAEVQRATRRYAKRQLTWFRADPRVEWIDATGKPSAQVLDEASDLLSSDAPTDGGASE